MITNHVYQRVFRLRYGDNSGTCFTVDVDDRQYLVTARHVVPDIGDRARVGIHYKGDWSPLDVTKVGDAAQGADITVLAPSVRLSGAGPLPMKSDDIIFGQDTYFLGFPHGYDQLRWMKAFGSTAYAVVRGSAAGAARYDVQPLEGAEPP